jgi:hypothetical protein
MCIISKQTAQMTSLGPTASYCVTSEMCQFEVNVCGKNTRCKQKGRLYQK